MIQPKLTVLFQNSEIIVVDKPEGISVHNVEDPSNLLLLLEKQIPGANYFPVHRLDKETSGVQIFALNTSAAQKYAMEFQTRAVTKKYVGITRGIIKQSDGIWKQPLTDKAEGRKTPQGTSSGRLPCETRFRVLKQSKYFSLCEFDLITGRQHQIRKHTALANHALLGDFRYGEAKYNEKMAQIYGSDRMFLHCAFVEIQGQKINSPVPEIFHQLVKE